MKIMLHVLLLLIISSVAVYSLEIDTTRIHREAELGDVIEGIVNVVNSENSVSLSVDINIEDMVYDSTEQKVEFKPFGTMDNSCARWIKINPSVVKIPPKSSQAVTYIITVPQELKHAQYFAVLFFTTGNSIKEVTSESVLIGSQTRMGVIVKVTIPALAKPAGKIEAFQVIPANEESPMKLIYAFINKGNILQKVFGSFSIIDKEGNLFGRGNMKRGLANPGEKITIESIWDGDLEAKTYDLIAEFKYEPKIIEIKEVNFENQYQE